MSHGGATADKADSAIKAVFFDVDFTLIYPGPTFQAEGYRRACAAHGIEVDPSKFDEATAASSFILDEVEEPIYNHDIFIHYTASIIEKMGGRGANVLDVAREIYDQWSVNHHFEMYDDVPEVLHAIAAMGLRIGLISNSHRCLASFQSHFELQGLVSAAVSSSQHGYLKPHPSIFLACLQLLGVPAGEAVMVGDSVGQDVAGALRAGMRAVLVRRGAADEPFGGDVDNGVPVITSLRELVGLLQG